MDSYMSIDRLASILGLQEYNQTHVYGDGTSPRDYDDLRKIEFIKTNVLAATDELHELLSEVGWKPWASSRHINIEAARSEAIDVLHFVNNLFIALEMDAEMIDRLYHRKSDKNVSRQEAGYDGVSTKCPGCARALDDDGVECGKLPAGQVGYGNDLYIWCVELGNWVATK
jgi:hypothetical protein